jgi:hypothetical protein
MAEPESSTSVPPQRPRIGRRRRASDRVLASSRLRHDATRTGVPTEDAQRGRTSALELELTRSG